MDEIDYKIIKLLDRNARMSFVEVAEKIGITEGAVRYRVKRMQNKGELIFTIKHRAVEGLVLIKTMNIPSVIKQLKEFSDNIYEISGEYDIATIIDAPTIAGLNKKIDMIRAIKGVIDTNTAISLVKR